MLHDLNLHLIEQAAQATARSRANPFHAEIVPGCTPNWHILVCQANNEQIAAGHLIGRGFGTYLPQFTETVVERGRKKDRTWNMFPGYLFLFVWDIHFHWRRIMSCVGVGGVLCLPEPSRGDPGEIIYKPEPHQDLGRILDEEQSPLVVPDHLIREIESAEWKRYLNDSLAHALILPRYKKKRGKKVRDFAAEDREAAGGVTLSPKSYWNDLPELDDSGRNSLLHRALGLACSASLVV